MSRGREGDRSKPARRPRGSPPVGLTRLKGCADRQARRVAVSILEVLAGVKSPSEIAEVLGVSLTRYYALESRALEGLIESCRSRPKGPRQSPEREIARLKREVERLERDGARSRALLRVAQRAVGIPAAKPETRKETKGGKRRRRRKPVARALRAAEAIEPAVTEEPAPAGAGGDHPA